MKNLFLSLFTALLCLGLNAQDFANAGEYMNYFSKQYEMVAKDQWAYTRLVARGKGARRVDNKREALIKSNHDAEIAIKQIKDYKGSTSLRDTVKSYFHLAQIVLKEDYGKIMDMEEVAEQSYDGMEALILARKIASDKLDRANIRVIEAQKRFAEAHGVELREDKSQLTKNLMLASDVFDYYNSVYLIFFKSYKQEGYLIDAMNRGDVNAMEQNKSALMATSAEGLVLLKEHKQYLSDPQIRMACEALLKFYADEASEKMPVIINFYVQKENYEKIKASMESKKKKEITQEDVDAYNKSTADFNTAVNEFNAVNTELNTKRDALLTAWNEKVESFLDRHVPK